MKHLLDTHVWLWFVAGDARLPAKIRRAIERDPDLAALSSISVWELSRLIHRRRFTLPGSISITEFVAAVPFRDVQVNRDIALETARFPQLRDPGDALIAATASVYDLTLLTVDEELLSTPGLRTRGG